MLQRTIGSQSEGPAMSSEEQHLLAIAICELKEATMLKPYDNDIDAKHWPVAHPYGTGSLRSEENSGGIMRYSRNRLNSLQSWFRKHTIWGFWMLDRHIKNELNFKNKQQNPSHKDRDDLDSITRNFGTRVPNLVESAEWWANQRKDLFAMSDEAECGLAHAMVTVTHNDNSPELLAYERRGPLSEPTPEECIEYLLDRKPVGQIRPASEKSPCESVQCFQRRLKDLKRCFLTRNLRTPLGNLREYWSRTEAQMRGALHEHMLVWFNRRNRGSKKKYEGKKSPDHTTLNCPAHYTRQPPIQRTVKGDAPRQRPAAQTDTKAHANKEDEMYHRLQMARVSAEMVRPDIINNGAEALWGGYNVGSMRVAFLARAIQSRLYLHSRSAKYCLKNRSRCRFFYPWPEQKQQQVQCSAQAHQCCHSNVYRFCFVSSRVFLALCVWRDSADVAS